MKYRVHRFDLDMNKSQRELEGFLNTLQGEIVAIIPNISLWFFWIHRIDFLLVVEKTA